jgi:rifampin ADP-ribosylating transferase
VPAGAGCLGRGVGYRAAGEQGRGYIYIVEPTGTFEDDPNPTNKRFPNSDPVLSCHPLKIVGKVEDWQGHPPDVLQMMLDSLKEKMRNGQAAIED